MGTGLVSIIIPSRNEPYLKKTILDLIEKASGEIEIIAILDGYWPTPEEIVQHDSVHYIHYSKARGMRNAINAGVAVSNGEYILKCDAHVLFDYKFDEVLKADCKDDWVVVPRRYALDPEHWEIEDNPKYPIDYMYLSKDLHGVNWPEKNKDQSLKEKEIDDLMSFQGSCWFMKRSYYDFLELMNEEEYGSFASEAQEIGLKAWLSGGRVVVNKKTFYAHWHKTVGRGYSLSTAEFNKGADFTLKWLDSPFYESAGWHKQTKDIRELVEQFAPVPTW